MVTDKSSEDSDRERSDGEAEAPDSSAAAGCITVLACALLY